MTPGFIELFIFYDTVLIAGVTLTLYTSLTPAPTTTLVGVSVVVNVTVGATFPVTP